MIFRATDWMSSRWWAALAIVMAFILVARTGTVGAPAEARVDERAMVREFSPQEARRYQQLIVSAGTAERAQLSLERHVRYLESELTILRQELELERERAEILASGYESLEDKFESVTTSFRGVIEADAPGGSEDLVPMPIEAIYVVEPEAVDATTENQER